MPDGASPAPRGRTAGEDRPVYLDHAASMPLCEAAKEAIRAALASGELEANPSSLHRPGRRARYRLDEARESLAARLGVEPGEILFTSGGTEADNLALAGAARAIRREAGRQGVVVSRIEHHAILEAAQALEREGFVVRHAACDGRGVVTAESVRHAIRQVEEAGASTGVVAVMWVNNEVGSIQPVEAIRAVAEEAGAAFVVDAVQAAFVEELGNGHPPCDLLTLSAHKFGGPKGAGAVYVRRGVPFDPITHGGGQERALRPGTENVLGIVAMAAAFDWARREALGIESRRRAMEELLLGVLFEGVPGVAVNAGAAPRVPGLLNVFVPGVRAETLLVELDRVGVACSSGAACTAGSMKPSHVLQAMGLDDERVACSIRLSLGAEPTAPDVELAGRRIVEAVARLRARRALIRRAGEGST